MKEGKVCIFCNNKNISRLHRKWWMKMRFGSKLYYCRDCCETYLVWGPFTYKIVDSWIGN